MITIGYMKKSRLIDFDNDEGRIEYLNYIIDEYIDDNDSIIDYEYITFFKNRDI